MLDINQIKEIIPQRSPFLLVDRIDLLEEGKRGLGKNVYPIMNHSLQDTFHKRR